MFEPYSTFSRLFLVLYFTSPHFLLWILAFSVDPKLGTDVTITIDKTSFNFNYSFSGSLKEQIKETKLTLALLRKQPVIVGGKVLPIDFSLDFHGHTEQEASDRLSALSRIEEMLRTLHISKDLNLGDLSDKDLQGLNYLVSGIVDHRPVPFNINGKPG